MALLALLPVLGRIPPCQRGVVIGPTHPIQIGTGVIALAVIHACTQPAAHVARVEVEAGAWVLQVQQREQPVGVKLTAKLHIHTSAIVIHTIQQGLGED